MNGHPYCWPGAKTPWFSILDWIANSQRTILCAMPANRRGLNAGEVLAAAGPPFVSQRQDNCETWFYKGTGTALENRMVVVQLCNNKVVSATTELWFKSQ